MNRITDHIDDKKQKGDYRCAYIQYTGINKYLVFQKMIFLVIPFILYIIMVFPNNNCNSYEIINYYVNLSS